MRHLRPHCSHCVYWMPDSTANPPTVGHCHRNPPGVLINPTTGTIVQKFPSTDHLHWCGEWNGDDSALVAAARAIMAQSG